eukprot:CAMPEP_0184645382 /NCGR_PEP_ID=MMETSP0308-20130426/1839_1 /TAXON_ID=38269 /ORGANISM="Gloeochaete witrockiana, Strain SAG 46.84" /LENGTH=158 /DNA_ID=CAMNT_0027074309 /DNA_START=133 /DNA_END=609 /DNA_ORIENTATION=+
MSSKPAAARASSTSATRPAPPPPAPVARQASRPATSSSSSHAPPPAHAPAAGAPMMSQGPGLLGSMMATAAGSAVGHVVGRGIGDAMFGGRNDAPAPQAEAAVPAASSAPTSNSSVCVSENDAFKKCLEQNGEDNFQQCQWTFQMLQQCKKASMSGFQ